MFINLKTRYNTSCLTLLALVFCFFTAADAQDGYISARGFADTQGIAYQWFPIQKVLVMRKGLRSVKLTVNQQTAIVDEVETPLPAPVIVQDGQLMVPAAAMTRFFSNQSNTAPANMSPVAITPAPPPAVLQPSVDPAPPAIEIDAAEEAVLVALRHSGREDHTRVVLEFSEQITYKSDFKDGVYRLNIMGCRNLIPTKRTNPAGRDISKLDINSGPDRKGLILTFHLNQKEKQPSVETVGTPFRMIISFAAPKIDEVATTTVTVADQSNAAKPEIKAETTAPVNSAVEKIPEITIEVPPASLNNPAFAGRTIVIDAGHGGNDRGITISGRPDEKNITFSVAGHLKNSLEKIGFKAVLIRSSDIDMPQSQRIAVANKNGGDLFISLHAGASNDKSKAGFAVYSYNKSGTAVNQAAQGLSHEAVYSEWLKNTRFDLAEFLARKVMDRLQQHLKVENRGVMSMPLLPLKFIMNPAIIVETGMLSDPTESKNLMSDNYRKAIAQAIANAVVDFFNGIVINP